MFILVKDRPVHVLFEFIAVILLCIFATKNLSLICYSSCVLEKI